MTRKTNMNGLELAPRWIVMFLGAYLMVHLFVLYLWNAAGQVLSLQGASDSSFALSVTGCWNAALVLSSAERTRPRALKSRSR